MGFILLPLVVLSWLIGMLAIQDTYTEAGLPQAMVEKAELSGQTFVAYRDAVVNYQKNNPTFIGSVSAEALAAQGNLFSAVFLDSAGNDITPAGVAGRIITSYAELPTGAINAALDMTENDASFGIALTNKAWMSSVHSTTSMPLATSVPSGALVSVVQVGN